MQTSPLVQASPATPIPLEHLEAEICHLAGQIAAATCRWLLLVAEFDRREGWAGWGVLSCAHWLSWKCGLGLRAAHEHVRVAHALEHLRLVQDAFAAGRISYAKARAICRVATEATEADLLMIAEHSTAAQLERVVSGYRRAHHLMDGKASDHEPFLRWQYDDDGCVTIRARLAPEDGALLIKALEAARADLVPPPAPERCGELGSAEPSCQQDSAPRDERDRSSGRLNAEALVVLARRSLDTEAATGEDERYQVVVHVDAETLAHQVTTPDTLCELDSGWALSPQTVRRLSCDADIVRLIARGDTTLDAGRKTRVISRRLRRALAARDRHCRAPACHARIAEWHHVRHWIDGGPTNARNLVGLCSYHHHQVHDGHLLVSVVGRERFEFRRADGNAIPAVPRPPELTEEWPGSDINPDTIVPDWAGDSLDLDYVVATLCQQEDQRALRAS